jgi:single-strand DNA-binding protein
MSNNLNTVTIIGRLTRDAELKYTNGGTAVVNASIASNYRTKSGDNWQEAVNFFELSFFGKGAEAVYKYMTKGKQVAVSGELRQERWEQDGQNRSKVKILAHQVQLLGTKNSEGGNESPVQEDDYHDDAPF